MYSDYGRSCDLLDRNIQAKTGRISYRNHLRILDNNLLPRLAITQDGAMAEDNIMGTDRVCKNDTT